MRLTIDAIMEKIRGGRVLDLIMIVPALAVPAVTILALIYPPVIVSQGQAHRIFYIHVPVAWVALYAPLVSALCGIAFLITRREMFDVWSLVNARIALLFALGVVISGPLWAATEWGTYWNGKDPRLMSFFVLVLCLGGYFLIRNLTDDETARTRYAAVMAVVSALSAVATWLAIRVVTPDTHPTSVMGTMAPEIRRTFWYSVLGYHLLFLFLLRWSLRAELIRRAAGRLEAS
ncbi:MAG: cytochrome c biogenesis protein CcsA [Spirochaetia bacterium]|nr:cytochrome c biogenesis protein CcsA [Spirochaetia bacterium]